MYVLFFNNLKSKRNVCINPVYKECKFEKLLRSSWEGEKKKNKHFIVPLFSVCLLILTSIYNLPSLITWICQKFHLK